MSDFEDRLTALDPAAGQPYQYRDLDALITRITSQPVVAKSRRWQGIHLRISGTLLAGALVVAGAVALNGTSGLPVLALQSTTATHTPQRFAPASSSAMAIDETLHFTPGPELNATSPTSHSYELAVPASAAVETARLATIFDVTGTPVNTSGDGVDWSVTNSSGATLDYANSGVPEWSYAAATSKLPTDAPVSDLPSQTTLASDVQRVVAKLGYGYTISSPNFATTTSSDSTTMSSTSTRDVTYTVDVDGTNTDQTLSFSVDSNNDVVNASGPAFAVASTLNYPLESAVEGVDALNAAHANSLPSTSPLSSTPSTSPASSPTSSPVVQITLNNDSLALETYQLTNGSLWLLPEYEYQGEGTGLDGSPTSGTWYALALEPSYVHVSTNASGVTTHGGTKN